MAKRDSLNLLVDGFSGRIHQTIRRIGTFDAVAKKLGVAPATLFRWVRGESMPPFNAMATICKLAGTDIYWLAFNEASVWSVAIGQHSVSVTPTGRQNA